MILLVEDERFVREVMGQVLRAAGYRVVVSENAAQARRAFRLHGGEIQLLITDVIMPGENGRKLASGLRARKRRLPTLFISGYPESAKEEDHRSVCDFYLPKPFSAQLLSEKVDRILRHQD
jgi:DNA-binding NtrC family response regulator